MRVRTARLATGGSRRGRALRRDAGRRERLHLCRPVQPTSELRLGRRRHRHDPGGGDLACGSLVADRNSAIGSGPGWPGYREQQDVA